MKRLSHASVVLLSLLVPSGSILGGVARTAAGGVLGVLAGTGVSIGIVVARVQWGNHYLETVDDFVGWQAAPIPVGVAAGAAAGAAGGATLGAVAAGVIGGSVLGAGVGALIGFLASAEPEIRWAAGVMGGAVGLVLGAVAAWAIGRRRRGRRAGGRASPAAAAAIVVAAAGVPGCQPEPRMQPAGPDAVSEVPADPAPVEDVVFLVGDPGEARYHTYPVLPRVAESVESWAERVGRDSAVSVLILGDVIYPDGMHDPGTAGFPEDSARVTDQASMVMRPGARDHDARLYFLAGNHDWGLREDRPGAMRLRNLGRFVDQLRERGGTNIDLAPDAGSGIPRVVDIGDRLRLVLLDTAWWIFDAEPDRKVEMIDTVRQAMATAGDRQVVLAAHHPWQSAGPHAGHFSIWQTLGVRYLLYKSGALLQDLSARPYIELKRALGEVFEEEGRPLAFAGGHEHSLQVIGHGEPAAPRFSLVSGSASRLSGVGPIPGTFFARSAPGYMVLLIRENGAVDVEAHATPPQYVRCTGPEATDASVADCMQTGLASFELLYRVRLLGPSGASAGAPPSAPGTGAATGSPPARPGR